MKEHITKTCSFVTQGLKTHHFSFLAVFIQSYSILHLLQNTFYKISCFWLKLYWYTRYIRTIQKVNKSNKIFKIFRVIIILRNHYFITLANTGLYYPSNKNGIKIGLELYNLRQWWVWTLAAHLRNPHRIWLHSVLLLQFFFCYIICFFYIHMII